MMDCICVGGKDRVRYGLGCVGGKLVFWQQNFVDDVDYVI